MQTDLTPEFDVSTTDLQAIDVTLELQHRVQQFLFAEARLLDARRLQEWMDLWTDDGMYWVPHQHAQPSPFDHISLIWEDKMLREVRTRRLNNPRNWSQQPVTRTARLIGNVSIAGIDAAGCLVVHAVMQLSEWRNEAMRQLPGQLTYKLQPQDDSWQIRFKRVDLINCDGIHQNLQVFV